MLFLKAVLLCGIFVIPSLALGEGYPSQGQVDEDSLAILAASAASKPSTSCPQSVVLRGFVGTGSKTEFVN